MSSLLGFVQNLAMDPVCWPNFEHCLFVDIFAIYTKALDCPIRFMALYVLSLLVELIPFNKQDVLVLDEERIKEFVDILTTAVSTPKLQATKVYGSLVIPADDILRIVKQIWCIESNRKKIAGFLSTLVFPIEMCLQLGDEMQQMAALDLLWTLLSDPNILMQVKADQVNVDMQLLERMNDSTFGDVRVMTSCVLGKLSPDRLERGMRINQFSPTTHALLWPILGACTCTIIIL